MKAKIILILILSLSLSTTIYSQDNELKEKPSKTAVGKGIAELDKAAKGAAEFIKNLFKNKKFRLPYKLGTKNETKIKKHPKPNAYIPTKAITLTSRDSFYNIKNINAVKPELEIKVMYPRLTFDKGYVSFQLGDYKYLRYLDGIKPEDIEYIKLINPNDSSNCEVKKFKIITKKKIKRHFSFILDHSGSMGDERASSLQRGVYNAISKDFYKNNDNNTKYTIHKFDGEGNQKHLVTSQNLIDIKNELIPPIGLKGFGYSTAIKDALLQGIEILSKDNISESKIIVLFTDGVTNTDRTKLKISDVVRQAIDNNINIVVVGFGAYVDDNYLNLMTYYAGGNLYRIYRSYEFDQLFDNILTDVDLSVDIEFSPCMFGDEIEIELKVKGIESSVIGSTYFRTPIKEGYSIDLDILFKNGKFTIQNENFEKLDQLVQLMNYKAEMKVLVEGHTDKLGSEKTNLWLSEKRANSVKQYLLKKGINANRIQTKGFGSSKPAYPYNNSDVNELNRRIEIVITN